MTSLAICAPAAERFVAARQDDVQMQPGELIQQHNVMHMIAATDSFIVNLCKICHVGIFSSMLTSCALPMMLALLAIRLQTTVARKVFVKCLSSLLLLTSNAHLMCN